ncbi:hypothetical protein LCGC14_1770350 [marine sediment metagenome]|uniref:Uncharacterized protein n=1 Tax=marine sediment metagenome TaxID=412755 RepID=A0A0F9GYI6_9ZZZZ
MQNPQPAASHFINGQPVEDRAGDTITRLPPPSPLPMVVGDNMALDNWRSRGPFGAVQNFGGILIVTQSLENHMALVNLLDQLRAVTRDNGDPGGPDRPEAMFTPDGKPAGWVAALLARARAGKLSKFSSVLVRKIAGRTFARIGGIWFDASLRSKAKIHLVRRASPAEDALRAAAGKLQACFALGRYVILAAGKHKAVSLDALGIVKADDPTLKRILAAIRK